MRPYTLLALAAASTAAGCLRVAALPPSPGEPYPAADSVAPSPLAFASAALGPPTPAPKPTLPPADAEIVQPPVRPLGDAPAGSTVVARATIAAVGDVLLHDGVQKCAKANATRINCEGFDELYRHVSQYLAAADVTFANVETPVTMKAPRGTGGFTFNAPPASVKALKRAGIDVVSFANNHVYDQGRPGFVESMEHLEALRLPFAGAGRTRGEAYRPVVLEAGGLKIAFLAFTELLNNPGRDVAPAGEPHVAIFDIPRAERAVREAAAIADAVIVSAHWGTEYVSKPGRYQVDKAHRMIAAGAIAVLGHHPHVLQPIELYRPEGGERDGVIAYSLGNFISNQGGRYSPAAKKHPHAPRREGVLLRIELVRRDVGGGKTRVEVEGIDALPLWTENNLVQAARDKTGATKPSIHVVALDRAIANVERELARIPDPPPPALVKRRKELLGWEAIYRKRKESIRRIVGERFVREIERTPGIAAGFTPRPVPPPTLVPVPVPDPGSSVPLP